MAEGRIAVDHYVFLASTHTSTRDVTGRCGLEHDARKTRRNRLLEIKPVTVADHTTMDSSIQYLIDFKFKERKKKTNSGSTDDDELTNDNTQTDIAVAVMNDTVKNETTTLKESQSHANQKVSATLAPSSTKIANITTVENGGNEKSEQESKNPISANLELKVNNDPEKENAKIVKQSNVDQEVSATPVTYSTITAKTKSMENNKNLKSKKEIKTLISTNTGLNVDNGPIKEKAKIVKQKKVDQEVSATPVPPSSKNADITTMKNNEETKSTGEKKNVITASIQANSGLNVHNGPKNKKAKIVKQSNMDQKVSATPVSYSNITEDIKTMENNKNLKSKREIKNLISTNMGLSVNNGPKKEKAKIVKQLNVDQKVSATPVTYSTITANKTNMENNEDIKSTGEIENVITASIQANSGLSVNNGPKKEKAKIVKQLNVDQKVSATTVTYSTITANKTTMDNNEDTISKGEIKNVITASIQANSGPNVSNDHEIEKTKIVKLLNVDQEVSVIPVPSLIKTADITTMEIIEDTKLTGEIEKVTPTIIQADSGLSVNNGPKKEKAKIVKQLNVDQKVSATPVTYSTITANKTNMVNNEDTKSTGEIENVITASIQANSGMKVNNGPEKEKAKIVKQLNVDQKVSVTPVPSSIKTADITTMKNNENTKFTEQIEKVIPTIIQADSGLSVNNGPKKEKAKIVKQLNVDQKVSATPVTYSTITANKTNMVNNEDTKSTGEIENVITASIQANSGMKVNNGPEKEKAKIVKQLNVDQKVSVTPVPSSIKTADITTMKNNENTKFTEQIEKVIPTIIQADSGLSVNNGPKKEKAKIVKQLNVDQKVSATPVTYSTITANKTNMVNNEDTKSTGEIENVITASIQANSGMKVNNGPEKEKAKIVKQLNVDQKVSVTPVPSSIKTADITTMKNNENTKFTEQIEKVIPTIIQADSGLSVNNGPKKEKAKIVKQLNVDQKVSATPVTYSTITANITTMKNNENTKFTEQIEKVIPTIIQADSGLSVNNGPKKEKAKIVKQLNVDQKVSVTPVPSSIKTADKTTMENNEDIKSTGEIEKVTPTIIQADSGLNVNIVPEKENAKIVKHSNVDQYVSATPGPFWLNNSNPVEIANLLKNIKDFKPGNKMEHNHESINNNGQSNSGIYVNQRPDNEVGDTLRQSTSSVDQNSAASQQATTSSTKTSEINNSSEQTQPGELNEITRKTIYVGNLDFSISVIELMNCFSIFGLITNLIMINDRVSTHSKGYAFIQYNDISSIELALGMNGLIITKSKIVVQSKKSNEPVNYAWLNNQRPDSTNNLPLPMPGQMPMPAQTSMPAQMPMHVLMSTPMTHTVMLMAMPMITPMVMPMMPTPITSFNYVQQNDPQQTGTVFMPNMYYKNPNYYSHLF